MQRERARDRRSEAICIGRSRYRLCRWLALAFILPALKCGRQADVLLLQAELPSNLAAGFHLLLARRVVDQNVRTGAKNSTPCCCA